MNIEVSETSPKNGKMAKHLYYLRILQTMSPLESIEDIPCFACYVQDRMKADRCRPIDCVTLTKWAMKQEVISESPKQKPYFWSDTEIQLLKQKWAEGYTAPQIGKALNRSKHSVYVHAHNLINAGKLQPHTTGKPKFIDKDFWWTQDDLQKLRKLVSEGKSYPQLVKAFPNRSALSIRQQITLLRRSGKLPPLQLGIKGASGYTPRENSIKVTLPKKVYTLICQIAETTGKSKSEIIRDFVTNELDTTYKKQ